MLSCMCCLIIIFGGCHKHNSLPLGRYSFHLFLLKSFMSKQNLSHQMQMRKVAFTHTRENVSFPWNTLAYSVSQECEANASPSRFTTTSSSSKLFPFHDSTNILVNGKINQSFCRFKRCRNHS